MPEGDTIFRAAHTLHRALAGSRVTRHRQLQSLGPDLLADEFDDADVLQRMRAHPREAVADVLLNQRIVSGIGNVFKSEILYGARVDPFSSVAALSDEQLSRLVHEARRQLRANVLARSQTLSPAFGRRTTRSLDPREKLWVYGRGGKPCRTCGAPIRATKTGVDARLTYWCPGCQTGH